MLPRRTCRRPHPGCRPHAERRCPGTPALGARRGMPSRRSPDVTGEQCLPAHGLRGVEQVRPGNPCSSRGPGRAAVRGSRPSSAPVASTRPGGTGSRGQRTSSSSGNSTTRTLRDSYPVASSLPRSKLHRMAAARLDMYMASSSSSCWRWIHDGCFAWKMYGTPFGSRPRGIPRRAA